MKINCRGINASKSYWNENYVTLCYMNEKWTSKRLHQIFTKSLKSDAMAEENLLKIEVDDKISRFQRYARTVRVL